MMKREVIMMKVTLVAIHSIRTSKDLGRGNVAFIKTMDYGSKTLTTLISCSLTCHLQP